ncbi:MAG: NUDIX hydrolase, partial [bacterium]
MENKSKRITAHLIPYKIINGEFFFFLQKRSDDAERAPGWFTIFGGGVELGETAEEAMLREVKEELNFIPNNYSYLDEYSDNYSLSYYYIYEVTNN